MKLLIDKIKNNNSYLKIFFTILFITLPFLGFYLGMEYQKAVTPVPTESETTSTIIIPKPTNDPTANWKTYRNEKYGFELRYPKDYELTASELATSLLLFPIAISWEVISNERYENYSLSNVVQEESKRDIPYEKIKETQLNNYDAVTIDFKMVGGNQTEQSVFVKHPDNNLYIRFNLGGYSMAEPLTPSPRPQHIPSDKDFNQILSTFKFL